MLSDTDKNLECFFFWQDENLNTKQCFCSSFVFFFQIHFEEGCPGKAVSFQTMTFVLSWIINGELLVNMTFLTIKKLQRKKIILHQSEVNYINFLLTVLAMKLLDFGTLFMANVCVVQFSPFSWKNWPYNWSLKWKKVILDWQTEMGSIQPWRNICQNAQKIILRFPRFHCFFNALTAKTAIIWFFKKEFLQQMVFIITPAMLWQLFSYYLSLI